MDRKSVFFTGLREVELRVERLPELRAGELLVETSRSLISTGTEMTIFNRNFDPGTHWDKWVTYPFTPGYLLSGRVVEVGGEVVGWKAGDRIATRRSHASLTFAKPHEAARIPDGVSDDAAAWMGLGKIVQVGVRAAEQVMGDVVVVIGLGLLGQLVVQYARLMGAAEVIAIDTAAMRLELASAHGATIVLQTTADKAADEVLRLTAGRGADVVYDVTGHHAVLASALELTRKRGTVVLLGDSGTPGKQTLSPDLMAKGIRLIGAHDNLPPQTPNEWERWSALQMYDLFLTYLSRGQIRVEKLITHRFQPGDIAEAYRLLNANRDKAMGVMLEW